MLTLSKPTEYYRKYLDLDFCTPARSTYCDGRRTCNTQISADANDRCSSKALAKYGGKCMRHSVLPDNAVYTCMYKFITGEQKGEFCVRSLEKHRLFCNTHSCGIYNLELHVPFPERIDVQLIEKDIQFKEYVFIIFQRGLKRLYPGLQDDTFSLIKDNFMDQNPFDTLKHVRYLLDQTHLDSYASELISRLHHTSKQISALVSKTHQQQYELVHKDTEIKRLNDQLSTKGKVLGKSVCYCGEKISHFEGVNYCSSGCDYAAPTEKDDQLDMALDSGCECKHHKLVRKRMNKRKR